MDELKKLKQEIEYLKEENKYYKELLINNKINFKPFIYQESKDKLTVEEKINIYMDYFKGRSDVFAERWESKGKSGYSPVCANKFINGLCNLTKYKCQNCPNSKNVEFTKEEVIKHIKGTNCFGIYPMMEDDTCNFIVIDFDEKNYKKEANFFIDECKKLGIDTLREISRSGNGAHVWIFLKENYPAIKIRKIVSCILTSVMNKHGIISFNSYDRMFPSQDKLVKNGIGNLIALPLSGQSGKKGTTLFVDENFIPYENQFKILKETKKVEIDFLEELYEKLNVIEENGTFENNIKKHNLEKSDFSDSLIIEYSNEIIFNKKDLSNKAIKHLMRMTSFLNQKYYENQAKRLSVYNIPRIISLYKEDDEKLYLPRGCFEKVIELLKLLDVNFIINDNRNNGEKLEIDFKGTLKEEQKIAVNELLKYDNGIFVAPTGFGKTVVATYLINELKVNTLILVNNKNLSDQWIERLNSFLEIKYKTDKKYCIGSINSTSKKITNKIDVALIQTLASNEEIRKKLDNYGLIIFDEVHHLAAVSYEKVLRNLNAKYIYGFTATPKRSDGYEKINYMVIGPIRYQYDKKDQNTFKKILYPHFTKTKLLKEEKCLNISEIQNKLSNDVERNKLILFDIINAIKEKKKILILTNLVEHAKMLFENIKEYSNNTYLIFGSTTKKEKEENLRRIKELENEQFIIISTGKYIGEGFDEKRLDALFLTMPFKWRGLLEQYVGRLHREDENKSQVEVHDYIDINISVVFKMYTERQKGYKDLKYLTIDSNNKENILYDDTNYWSKLGEDLENAEKVIFISQYYNEDKMKILINKCKTVPIIYSSIALEEEKKELIEDINSNMILIDDSILWYGGINPFIFQKSDLSIARLEDKIICKDVIKQLNLE